VSEATRTIAIERRLSEFKALSYEEQLVFFGPLRRDLTRLLDSDEAAASVISDRFKPYLKARRPTPAARPAPSPAATRPPSRRSAPQPLPKASDDPASEAILQLVRRRPGQLTQMECLWVLRGLATDALRRKALTRDPHFGSFANSARALKNAAKQLRDRGAIEIAPDGKLYVSRRRGA
jgi:hypothetical protein